MFVGLNLNDLIGCTFECNLGLFTSFSKIYSDYKYTDGLDKSKDPWKYIKNACKEEDIDTTILNSYYSDDYLKLDLPNYKVLIGNKLNKTSLNEILNKIYDGHYWDYSKAITFNCTSYQQDHNIINTYYELDKLSVFMIME